MIQAITQYFTERNAGVIHLDSELGVCFVSEVAKKSISETASLKIRSSRLIAKEPKSQAELAGKLFSAVSESRVSSLFLGDLPGSRPIRVDILPNRTVVSEGLKFSPAVVLVIGGITQSQSLLTDNIREFYQLTNAELKLAQSIHQGLTLAEYAESQGLKISTVRWTLGNVLSKTSTKSQLELARLLAIFSK